MYLSHYYIKTTDNKQERLEMKYCCTRIAFSEFTQGLL